MIRLIEKDGWYIVGQVGSHKRYKHNAKKGRVTFLIIEKVKILITIPLNQL